MIKMNKFSKKLTASLAAILMFSAVFSGCSGGNTKSISTIKATEPKYKDENGIGYNADKEGKLTISTFKGSKTDIKIPSKYKGKKVTTVGRSSFKMAKIKSVTVPDTVTKIDDYAFAFSRELEKVVLPDSVKSIGTNAFAGCIKLKEIKLPKKLKTLGMYSFDASGLREITIPKSVKKVDEYAFAECKYLKSAKFNSADTKIADTAFNRSIDVIITAPKNSKAIKFAKDKNIEYKVK
jgi:hypothetical protein